MSDGYAEGEESAIDPTHGTITRNFHAMFTRTNYPGQHFYLVRNVRHPAAQVLDSEMCVYGVTLRETVFGETTIYRINKLPPTLDYSQRRWVIGLRISTNSRLSNR